MNQRSKLVQVPIKIHILKYIHVHGTWKGTTLDLRKEFYPKPGDSESYQNYFNDLEGKVLVPVIMQPSSIRHQYGMVQYFERAFKREMFAYIDARIELEGVFKPLRGFYSKYSIYPSDYDFDTAFKRYQREIKRREKQQKLRDEQNQQTLR